MKKLKYLLPLALFIVLAGFLVKGLYLDPHEVPSPLIGKPAPAFQLQDLNHLDRTVSSDELKGKVWLLNVWASWCESCREEHPYIMQLVRSGELKNTVVGLQYKDKVAPGLAFLTQYGNPYTLVLRDPEGPPWCFGIRKVRLASISVSTVSLRPSSLIRRASSVTR